MAAILFPAGGMFRFRQYSSNRHRLGAYDIPYPAYYEGTKKRIIDLKMPTWEQFLRATMQFKHAPPNLLQDSANIRRIYDATIGWHRAFQRHMTNNPRLLEDIGATERDFLLAKFAVPVGVLASEGSTDWPAAWAMQLGMAIFAAARGYEPAILSLARLYWYRERISPEPSRRLALPEIRQPVIDAALAMAKKPGISRAMWANAKTLAAMMDVARGEKEAARETLAQILDLDGKSEDFDWRPTALLYYGMLLREEGEHDKALAVFTSAASEYNFGHACLALLRDPENHHDEWDLIMAVEGEWSPCTRLSAHLFEQAAKAMERGDQTAMKEKEILAREWRKIANLQKAEDYYRLKEKWA